MVGFSSEGPMNAIELLKDDHEKVKELFDQFEDAKDVKEKKQIVEDACRELKIHSIIEEEIFYPAIREEIDDDTLMNAADEEHHEAKLIIAELEGMNGTESHFDAKFNVLTENIRHHIEEEEDEMMPKAMETGLDLEALGEEMARRKQELQREGVPSAAEEHMATAAKRGGSRSRSHRK